MKKCNFILAIFILASIFFSFLGCKQEPEPVLDVTAPGNVTGVKVTNISLDRTHLDSIMTNREIKVTVSGSNFDLLTSLLVQVTDGTTVQTPVVAVIDAEKNTAAATVTAPIPSSPTDNGTTYTVKAIIDSTTPSEVTTSFVVSKPAAVRSITLSESQIKAGTAEFVTATVKGKNFDIRGVTKVKLFDTTGAEVTASTVTVPLEENTSNTEFTVEIPVPTVDGVYTVAVFFDDVKDLYCQTIHIYDEPIITSVEIPTVGQTYLGGVVKITIMGKNFTAPEASATNFEYVAINGITITDFKILSDSKATAKMTTPFTPTNTDVTVSYGESYASSTLKFVAPENYYNVGDIILFDGTKVNAADVDTYGFDEQNKPIAMIGIVLYGGGFGLGMGLETQKLKWAPEGTFGCENNFSDIAVTVSGEEDNYIFEGDLDGSDNWEYICSVDPEGSNNPSVNYPAFNFANNYRQIANLTGSPFSDNWYVSSIKETYDFSIALRDNIFIQENILVQDVWFICSSQNPFGELWIYRNCFSTGYVGGTFKNDYYSVVVLRAFYAR